MKIRDTLIAGCCLFALLTALVGYFGGRSLKEVSGVFNAVTDDVVPHMVILDDLRTAGLRIVSSTLELAFSFSAGEGQGGQETDWDDDLIMVESARKMFDDALRRLDSHGSLAPEEREMAGDIRTVGLRMVGTSQEIVQAVQSGARPADLFALKERFVGEERAFLSHLERAAAYEAEELASTREEVSSTISVAHLKLATFSGVAFILAIVGGVFAARAIARPIAILHDGVVRVGRGALETRIDVDAHTEIGTLAAAFNQMTSDLRCAQDEIVATNSYLDNVIRSMVDALLVLSPDGTIVETNSALGTLLGYHEAELAGHPFAIVMDDRVAAQELLAELVEEGQVPDREVFYRAKDGEIIPVVISGAAMHGPAGEIQGLVCIAHDISERRRAEEDIRQLAYFDPLTGLPNRSLFQIRLVQTIASGRRMGGVSGLLYLYLDRFKDVNDTLGHVLGDQLLKGVTERLKGCVRQSDFLARVGGDEFAIIFAPPCDRRSIAERARLILDLLASPFLLDGKEIFISTSIGITLFPEDGEDGETLLRHVDMALYDAKAKGRNAYSFFMEEMNRSASERRAIEESLRRALLDDEFFLEYQPQIDLQSGAIFGVEALLRWRHPEQGLIPPSRFIPVAEEMGLIRRLGEWVLRSACLQCRAWIEAGCQPVGVAVNVSGYQFKHPDFVDTVERILAETGLEPELLELELTESTLMEGEDDTIMTLVDLKTRGVSLAIDDFGTGYSSLSYLKNFPIDRLKIDRAFVRDIATDAGGRAIVEAVVAMGRSLGLRVLAEGVEEETEHTFLRERGCDEVQGYLFGRPMPPDELQRRLAPAVPGGGSEAVQGECLFGGV
ncbi:EAL domain-containing protein [Geobacter pickeringii]|uniref:EAL domain-containing protein n=1 Tax=Geobacter pickeringii TaxID=345632 RepID=UPI00068F529E|nr:EAL domain-containing protein [Geobacter pickeringii]